MGKPLADLMRMDGRAKDQQEYLELKVAAEMEYEAARKFKESLRRKGLTEDQARAEMKRKGLDPDIKR